MDFSVDRPMYLLFRLFYKCFFLPVCLLVLNLYVVDVVGISLVQEDPARLPGRSASETAGRDSWTGGSCCRTADTCLHLHLSSGAVSSALSGLCRSRLDSPHQERGYKRFFRTLHDGNGFCLTHLALNFTVSTLA